MSLRSGGPMADDYGRRGLALDELLSRTTSAWSTEVGDASVDLLRECARALGDADVDYSNAVVTESWVQVVFIARDALVKGRLLRGASQVVVEVLPLSRLTGMTTTSIAGATWRVRLQFRLRAGSDDVVDIPQGTSEPTSGEVVAAQAAYERLRGRLR